MSLIIFSVVRWRWSSCCGNIQKWARNNNWFLLLWLELFNFIWAVSHKFWKWADHIFQHVWQIMLLLWPQSNIRHEKVSVYSSAHTILKPFHSIKVIKLEQICNWDIFQFYFPNHTQSNDLFHTNYILYPSCPALTILRMKISLRRENNYCEKLPIFRPMDKYIIKNHK